MSKKLEFLTEIYDAAESAYWDTTNIDELQKQNQIMDAVSFLAKNVLSADEIETFTNGER